MADAALKNLKVAILATEGVEQVERSEPRKALDAAGAKTTLVSLKDGEIRGWTHTEWGQKFRVDMPLSKAGAEDFDAQLLPGEVINPDKLGMDPNAVAFVKSFIDSGKPVAAICHGPWMVLEAGGARGRRMTSWPSLRTDLKNAGANWMDQEVVTDGMLVTSRKPDDIPAFNRETIKLFASARVAAK